MTVECPGEGYRTFPRRNGSRPALELSDDGYLFILTRLPSTGGKPSAQPHGADRPGPRQAKEGRGVSQEGIAFDMALAPTETLAYLLLPIADWRGDAAHHPSIWSGSRTRDAENFEPIGLSPDANRLNARAQPDADAERHPALCRRGRRSFHAAGARASSRHRHRRGAISGFRL
jgi:hypothetical protein